MSSVGDYLECNIYVIGIMHSDNWTGSVPDNSILTETTKDPFCYCIHTVWLYF